MIEVKDVSKSFKNNNVLKDVNVNFNPGRVYGFLGNNGAGKTTLMRIIFNMVIKNGGTITYDDLEQNKIDYSKWFYFTETDMLPKNLRVIDYLKHGALLANISKTEFRSRLKDATNLIETNFTLNKRIKKLSSGQQKIVSCLMLLILKPKVIFFDEPTANMDIKNQKVVMDMIKKLKSPNRIIVITTHLIKEVKDYLTDVVILDSGKITYKSEVNPHDDLEKIFDQHTTQSADKTKGMEDYLDE